MAAAGVHLRSGPGALPFASDACAPQPVGWKVCVSGLRMGSGFKDSGVGFVPHLTLVLQSLWGGGFGRYGLEWV